MSAHEQRGAGTGTWPAAGWRWDQGLKAVTVVERARVVSDVAGPHWVLGAVRPAPAPRSQER